MAPATVAVSIGSSDLRTVRALDVLATADRWVKAHRKDDGHAFFVVPCSDGRTVYYVDCRACTCPDFVRHGAPCKHTTAVKLWNAKQRAQQRPAVHAVQQPSAAERYAAIYGGDA